VLQTWKVTNRLLVAGLLGAALATPAAGQNTLAATKSIQLIAIKRASVGISLANSGPILFDLLGGETAGSSDPAWSVNWNLPARNQVVRVCVSLAGPLQSASGGAASIPLSRIEARPESAGAFRNFAGSACGQAAALKVSEIPISGANNKLGTQKDSVQLRVNDRGLNLPPGAYSGTLNILVEVLEAPAPAR
jgi:hypothetical protein